MLFGPDLQRSLVVSSRVRSTWGRKGFVLMSFLCAVAGDGNCWAWHPWKFVVAGGGRKPGCGPRPSLSHFDSAHRTCSKAALAVARCSSMGRCSHRCGKPRIWKPGVRELRERRGMAEENTCEGSGCRDFRARCELRRSVHARPLQKPADDPVLSFLDSWKSELSTWRETQWDWLTQPEDVDLTDSAKPHRFHERIDGKAAYGDIDSDKEPLCLLLVHLGSPLKARRAVLLVGLRRSLGRIWASFDSTSTCAQFMQILFGSLLFRLSRLLPWRWGDRLHTSCVRRPLRRLLWLLRGRLHLSLPPHTVEDFRCCH